MIGCSHCKCENDGKSPDCWNCGKPLEPTVKPVGAKERLGQHLADHFECTKGCEAATVAIKISTTGDGLSKFLDVHEHRFAAVSCTHCGYTEFFNLSVLEGKDHLGPILEALFEN